MASRSMQDASTRKKQLIEILGWYGMVAIVGAFALNSFNIMSSDTLLYQLLNMTGAIGLLFESFSKKAYQPGVLNIIWTVIAFIAIVRILFRV